MHSIERYGVIALIFLGGTVLAVLMWDRGSDETGGGKEILAAGGSASAPIENEREAQPDRPSRRKPTPRAQREKKDDVVRGQARPSSRPVRRDLEPRTPPAAEKSQPAFTSPGPRPSSATLAELRGDTGGSDPLADLLGADPASKKSAGTTDAPGRPGKGARPGSGARGLRRPGPNVYVVKSGDTLSEISLAVLGTSKRWKEIVDANPGLDPNRMVVGARLKLPTDAKAQSSPESPNEEQGKGQAKPGPGGKYVVGSGDSLWKIAQRTLGDGERWREIAELNPSIDPNKLLVGAKLVLPTGAKADAPRSTRSAPTVAKSEKPKKRGKVR